MEVKNTERLLKKFDEIGNMNVKKVIKDCTMLVEAQAKTLCPVDKGDLRGSIHPEVKEIEKTIYGRIYTSKEYAPYVEFGTGPKGNGTYPYKIQGYTLKYRDTKWCYPSTDEDGNAIFIWTKGQKAQPFMYPALEMNKKYIKKKIEDAVKEHISKFCGGGS